MFQSQFAQFDVSRTATGNESDLALACLVHIDELRDMHGVALGEPRHPDIATGAPWATLPVKIPETKPASLRLSFLRTRLISATA